MTDEIWTTRDGTRIAVGDMGEDHVRNALRMVLRNERRRRRLTAELIAKEENLPFPDERPDNHAVLADLRRCHGDAVAGMGGGNVYVDGRWVAWLGGI